MLIIGVCAVLSALPIPWLNSFTAVAPLYWLLLFFGGFLLPSLTGIMISSVGDYQKSSANSIANMSYNLFGYMPAPAIYGAISKITSKESNIPMLVLLYSSCLTIGLLFIGINSIMKKHNTREEDS